MSSEQRQLRRAIKRVPLKNRGFDSFLSPENMSQVALPTCAGKGAPLNRAADLDDVIATYQAIASLASWGVLVGCGWDEERSVEELRRGAKEIRKLSRSIQRACDDRLEALEGRDL